MRFAPLISLKSWLVRPVASQRTRHVHCDQLSPGPPVDSSSPGLHVVVWWTTRPTEHQSPVGNGIRVYEYQILVTLFINPDGIVTSHILNAQELRTLPTESTGGFLQLQ